MKALLLILSVVTGVPAVADPQGVADRAELDALGACVTEFRAIDESFASRIPSMFLALDPKARHLRARLMHVQRNHGFLAAHSATDQATRTDAFMIGNALVNCRQELERYESHLKGMYYFFVSVVVTAIFGLIYLIGMRVLATGAPADRGARENPPEPQDKTG